MVNTSNSCMSEDVGFIVRNTKRLKTNSFLDVSSSYDKNARQLHCFMISKLPKPV